MRRAEDHYLLNVARWIERSEANGPGERFVLWVQGCPLRCPGCHNPQFQPFRDATWMTVDDVEAKIRSVEGIEGVTLTGGEPFAQAQALAQLCGRLRGSGLSVMAYSGFTIEQLRAEVLPLSRKLLEQVDLLLDGPYREDLPSERPWRGSGNQRLIALTERYRAHVEEWNVPTGQQFEIHLDAAGGWVILGIPPKELVEFVVPGFKNSSEEKESSDVR